MAKLPAAFVKQMEQLLGERFPAFLDSYRLPRQQGLRVNRLKITAEQFAERSPYPLEPVPWTTEGFYISGTDRPGKHPYYHAGLYYVQEPSAMAPVELLDVQPGDKVLDLCAAPGGKTTQIAAKLQGRGLLVTNDNQPDRVKALAKNVELYGVTNAIVLNETPERLAPKLPLFFDKILVDAPCSGEGMFRKDEDMSKTWDELAPRRYAAMQREILAKAAEMLKPGGKLVYSTCTFSPIENEAVIAAFLKVNPDFRVAPVSSGYGFASGRPDWIGDPGEVETGNSCAAVEGTARLWPHLLRGEGHFAAVLERLPVRSKAGSEFESDLMEYLPMRSSNAEKESLPDNRVKRNHSAKMSGSGRYDEDKGRDRSRGKPEARGGFQKPFGDRREANADPFLAFVKEQLKTAVEGTIKLNGEYVYVVPDGAPELDGLRTIRAGWFAGTVRGGRFEPSHSLAMGLKRDSDAARSVSFALGDPDAVRYLKGETIPLAEERLCRSGPDVPSKGFCLVCIDGYPLGWAKWLDGMLKNEYPPGWRWT